MNELVTNAAKHGAGRINVAYKIAGDMHELSVCDEGDVLPKDFNSEQTAGFGSPLLQCSLVAHMIAPMAILRRCATLTGNQQR